MDQTQAQRQASKNKSLRRAAQSSPKNDVQHQPLRLKSLSLGRSSHNSSQRRFSEERPYPVVPQEALKTTGMGSTQKGSKIARYKQIEKELSHERRIRRDAELARMREARKLEDYELLKEREQREWRARQEEEERQRNYIATSIHERERLEAAENGRQRRLVDDTMEMMRKFEQEHPSLQFSGRFSQKKMFHEDGSTIQRSSHSPLRQQTTSGERMPQGILRKSVSNERKIQSLRSRDSSNRGDRRPQTITIRDDSAPLRHSPPREEPATAMFRHSEYTNEPLVNTGTAGYIEQTLKHMNLQSSYGKSLQSDLRNSQTLLNHASKGDNYMSVTNIGQHLTSQEKFNIQLQNCSGNNNSSFTLGDNK